MSNPSQLTLSTMWRLLEAVKIPFLLHPPLRPGKTQALVQRLRKETGQQEQQGLPQNPNRSTQHNQPTPGKARSFAE